MNRGVASTHVGGTHRRQIPAAESDLDNPALDYLLDLRVGLSPARLWREGSSRAIDGRHGTTPDDSKFLSRLTFVQGRSRPLPLRRWMARVGFRASLPAAAGNAPDDPEWVR